MAVQKKVDPRIFNDCLQRRICRAFSTQRLKVDKKSCWESSPLKEVHGIADNRLTSLLHSVANSNTTPGGYCQMDVGSRGYSVGFLLSFYKYFDKKNVIYMTQVLEK